MDIQYIKLIHMYIQLKLLYIYIRLQSGSADPDAVYITSTGQRIEEHV